MNYYIMKNNVQQGPYSEEDMEAMYIANRMPDVTPVWYEGAENWMMFSATPIFETFKSSKRHTFFLLFLPIYILPLNVVPLIIYIIFMTMRGGWKEIVSAAKRLKQSDNKKYEIFLLVGGLYPIIWGIVGLVCVITAISDTIVFRVITFLYFGIWVGLAIYSGAWKDFFPAAKKIYWAYKQARLLTKQQKKAS